MIVEPIENVDSFGDDIWKHTLQTLIELRYVNMEMNKEGSGWAKKSMNYGFISLTNRKNRVQS